MNRMLTLRRPRVLREPMPAAATGRPVICATLGVPFEPAAATFAVDAAVEDGHGLILINVVELPPLPMSVRLGYDQLEDSPDLAAALRAPAELARSLGVDVERLRVKSPRPVAALMEVVAERQPSLLVFGPDPAGLPRRVYRRAARAVREQAPCLVWIPS